MIDALRFDEPTAGGPGPRNVKDVTPNDDPMDLLPAIDANDQDLPRVAQQAIDALTVGNDPPTLFAFGGAPVRIEHDEHGTPVLRPLTEDRLRHHLARYAAWYVEVKTKRGEAPQQRPALPPIPVVRDLLAHPDLPLPRLARVIEAPAYDASGALCDEPGYHGVTSGLYYSPAAHFAIRAVPRRPTPADVAAARAVLLDDLLRDFPFVGAPERAHAVALLVLPFARDLIAGPTPLHLVEKSTPGTGATLLVDALLTPALGRSVAVMTEGRDEDEWRKRIAAKLGTSPAVVLIDNLRRRLDSAAMSAALTGTVWEDRVLGSSTMRRTPIRCCWVATGNNPALSNELTRRTVRIRLDAGVDRPWLRDGFQHPDLRGWAADTRPALVHAALTLVAAWLAAGRPDGGRTMGQYERWAAVMGGILHTAGIPGFLGNLETFYDDADDETAQWRAFVAAWAARHGEVAVGVADLFLLLTTDITLDLGDRGDRSQRIRLGKLLGRMRDRIFGAHRIVAVGDGKWRLRGAA